MIIESSRVCSSHPDLCSDYRRKKVKPFMSLEEGMKTRWRKRKNKEEKKLFDPTSHTDLAAPYLSITHWRINKDHVSWNLAWPHAAQGMWLSRISPVLPGPFPSETSNKGSTYHVLPPATITTTTAPGRESRAHHSWEVINHHGVGAVKSPGLLNW